MRFYLLCVNCTPQSTYLFGVLQQHVYCMYCQWHGLLARAPTQAILPRICMYQLHFHRLGVHD